MIMERATPSVFLCQGEVAIVREQATISTVLGSCVSLTFYHRRRRLAGMTHALLPRRKGDEGNRFVEGSAQHLLDEFLRHGAQRTEIEIKLFGGADMFGNGTCGTGTGVGRQNVAAALAFIEKEGLRLVASDVGGHRGRKIVLDAQSGVTLVQRLSRPGAKRNTP